MASNEQAQDEGAAKVYDLCSRRRPRGDEPKVPWGQLHAQLREIGPAGIEGYARALASPYWPARKTAATMIRHAQAPETMERIVALLTAALSDANKKVRRCAVEDLLKLPVTDARKRDEFVPKILPLLNDPSNRVRRMSAWSLGRWAEAVPLAAAAEALAGERDRMARYWKERLVRSVLRAPADK